MSLMKKGIALSDAASLPPSLSEPIHSAIDLISLAFIAALLLLSLLSLNFVLRLRWKNRRTSSHPLRNFNSLWTVRLLLVSLVCFWGLTQFLRVLPFLRRRPGFSSAAAAILTLPVQTCLCNFHLALSLGLLEPGFLITVLYLVNASVRKQKSGDAWAIAVVFATCLPILFIQALSVYLPIPSYLPLPSAVFRTTSGVYKDPSTGDESVLCAYPLLGTVIFVAFGVCFLICFWLSCWRVASVVINKGLRVRIYVLACTITISLCTEMLFMALSALWKPDDASHMAATLVVFLSALSCAVAGEGMLVIRPIADALAASGGGCYGYLATHNHGSQRPEVVLVNRESINCGGGNGCGGDCESGTSKVIPVFS